MMVIVPIRADVTNQNTITASAVISAILSRVLSNFVFLRILLLFNIIYQAGTGPPFSWSSRKEQVRNGPVIRLALSPAMYQISGDSAK